MKMTTFCGLVLATAFTLLGTTVRAAVVTIFTETAGTGAGTLSFANTPWDNPTFTFTGSGDTRSTTASTGYAGASGGRNVFLTNNGAAFLQISGINTTGFVESSFVLSFGAYKNTNASDLSELSVEYSSDGVNFSGLSVPTQPVGPGTANWRLITIEPAFMPSTSDLSLRFTNTGTGPQFRIDDISLYATAVPEPSSMALLSVAGVGSLAARRFRKKRSRAEEAVSA